MGFEGNISEKEKNLRKVEPTEHPNWLLCAVLAAISLTALSSFPTILGGTGVG